MKQSLFNREPAAIVAAVTALLALIAGSGVTWLTDQRSALVVGAVTAVITLISGGVTRSQVYAPATVEKIEDAVALDNDLH